MGRGLRHVALLRGINVGGKHKLAMGELRDLAATLGAEDVSSYIQSGNLVFTASASTVKVFGDRLETAIAEAYGFEVPVVIRDRNAWLGLVAQNPFVEQGVDPNALHIAFLKAKPAEKLRSSLDPERSPGDTWRWSVDGAALYLWLPNGVGRSKLTNVYLDKALGTTATVRNWKTAEALAALL